MRMQSACADSWGIYHMCYIGIQISSHWLFNCLSLMSCVLRTCLHEDDLYATGESNWHIHGGIVLFSSNLAGLFVETMLLKFWLATRCIDCAHRDDPLPCCPCVRTIANADGWWRLIMVYLSIRAICCCQFHTCTSNYGHLYDQYHRTLVCVHWQHTVRNCYPCCLRWDGY